MDKPTVEVLLATYNGANFLSAQIDSILNQSFDDFQILIRDDGSTDNTQSILKSYVNRYPEKIRILDINSTQKGPTNNFSTLIENSTAPYALLSDQDDIWLPNKIAISLEKIKQLESKTSSTTPLLVHTDLKVVDQNLEEINPSFLTYSGLKPSRDKFNNLLVQNIITGCTIIFNRPLADVALPIPQGAQMHDWWLALVTSTFGEIGFIKAPTVLYRQHGENTLGATGFNANYVYAKAREILSKPTNELLAKNFAQAAAFKEKYRKQLSQNHLEILNAFINLQEQNFFTKRLSLIKSGFLKGKLSQNIGLFLKL